MIFHAKQTCLCRPRRTLGPACTLRLMTGQMRQPTKVRFPLLAAAGRFCAFKCVSRMCAALPAEGGLADVEYACLAVGRSRAYGAQADCACRSLPEGFSLLPLAL